MLFKIYILNTEDIIFFFDILSTGCESFNTAQFTLSGDFINIGKAVQIWFLQPSSASLDIVLCWVILLLFYVVPT